MAENGRFMNIGMDEMELRRFLNEELFISSGDWFMTTITSQTWLYALGSVIVVSFISLVGVATLSLSRNLLNRILLFLVSFAVGS